MRIRESAVKGWFDDQDLDRDSRVALLMSLIATFGATTGFFASYAESHGSGCERRLQEAANLGLLRRQSYLGLYFEHARWADDYALHRERGNALLNGASAATMNDPITDLLNADAQTEFAVARTIKPVRDFFDPDFRPDLAADLRAALDERADRDLRELGIRNRCEGGFPPVSATGTSDFLQPLTSELASIHHRDEGDALAVVIFVLALVAFSLTDIASGFLRWVLDIAAIAAFIFATSIAIRADDGLILWFVSTFIAVVLVGAALLLFMRSRRNAIRPAPATNTAPHISVDSHSGEAVPERVDVKTDATSHLRHHGREHLHGNPNARWIVIVIAFVAFASAFGEYRHAFDKIRSDDTASSAALAQLELLRSEALQEATTYHVVRNMVTLREVRLRAAVAHQLHDAAPSGPYEALWSRQADHWSAAADLIDPLSRPYHRNASQDEIEFHDAVTGGDGPYGDVFFPNAYVVRSTVEPAAERLATWDAHDELINAWESKSILLLGAVTLFGIAFYLLGQALGMGRSGGATILTFFGVTVFVCGCILGGESWRIGLPETSDVVELPEACLSDQERVLINTRLQPSISLTRDQAAARCYARAEASASLPAGPDNRTIKAYKAATTLRHGLLLADYGAARALARIATPQKDTRYVSIVYRETLQYAYDFDKSVTEEFKSRDIALPPPLLESSVLHQYLLALDEPDRSSSDHAVVATREALHQEPKNLMLRYRLAVQLLAGGGGDADHEYKAAFAQSSGDANADVGAAAISDLEVLRASCDKVRWLGRADCDRIRSAVDKYEPAIVRAIWPSRSRRTRSTRPAHVAVNVTPAGIGWAVPATSGAEPALGNLLMMAYRFDLQRKAYYVIPEMTYRVPARSPSEQRDPMIRGYRSFLLASHYSDCMQLDAKYRVELYFDGRRIARTDVNLAESQETFRGVALRDVGVAMCYPEGWKQNVVSSGRPEAGYRALNDNRGAYAFAFIARPGVGATQMVALRQRAVALFVALTVRDIKFRIAPDIFRNQEHRCASYIVGWETPHVEYVSPSATVLAKAWKSRDGLIHVGLVWQRTSTPDALSCRILASMTTVDSETATRTPLVSAPHDLAK